MAPLGVKVLTVMTGIVQTNIFANHPDPKLPEGSLWEPASKEITKNADGSLVEGTTTPLVFASRVADDVLRGSTGLTWRGKMASIGWALSQFLPTWLLVSNPEMINCFSLLTNMTPGFGFNCWDWTGEYQETFALSLIKGSPLNLHIRTPIESQSHLINAGGL